MTTRQAETGSVISCLLSRPTARQVAAKVSRQVRSACRCRPNRPQNATSQPCRESLAPGENGVRSRGVGPGSG